MTPAVGSARPRDPIAVACLLFVVVTMVGYTVANAIVRPAIWSDSGWGLLAWDHRHGLPFNYSASPDFDDISRDAVFFLTIWSPGQHVLPGLLEEAGLSLGLAVVCVVAAFSALGLWGWFVLYRAFGFPLRTSALAVAIVAATRQVSASFGIYIGGEALLFGVAPWFLLLVWRLRDLRWTAAPLLMAGTLAMVFAKLSGIMVAAAAIGAAALAGSGPLLARAALRRGLVAGTTIAVVGAVFYYAWYSRGWTAVSAVSSLRWPALLDHAVFAVSSTWGSALSLVDLASYPLLHPSRPVLASTQPIAWAFLPFAVATYALVWRQLRRDHAEYLRFALLTGLAYGVALIVIRVAYGPEDRFFRIVSLLLFVGIVQAFLTVPGRALRLLAGAVAAAAVAYGLASHTAHLWHNLNRPLGIRDFRHPTANQAVIDFLHTIDRPGPDAGGILVYVPSPEIGLEVRHVRVLGSHADHWNVESMRGITYRGRVSRLYVLVQQKLVDEGKADIILRSFVDYPFDGWKKIPLGDFVGYVAGE